jgi:hypothetical protein
MAIPRFQGGSPHLCRLRTTLFWPRWQDLICTDPMLGFMGPNEPSSPVTTLSNRTPALRWFARGRMRQPRMMAGPSIARSQDFIPGPGDRFRPSRDFTDSCCM